MPVILVEGPEKAGKSTFVKALHEAVPFSKVRKFTGPMQGTEYIDAMKEDIQPSLFPLLTIWDRGWASEWVYSQLLMRPTAMTRELLGLLDNGLWISGGFGIMLLGPDSETLINKRDDTDLPVEAAVERLRFSTYTIDNENWFAYVNEHDPVYLQGLVSRVLTGLEDRR